MTEKRVGLVEFEHAPKGLLTHKGENTHFNNGADYMNRYTMSNCFKI